MNIWKDRNFSPMLLKEIKSPFNSKDYIFELKYDGVRALCYVNNNNIELRSRNNNDLSKFFPELLNIKNYINKNVIFDGEIVVFENDKPSFDIMQKRIRLKDNNKIIYLSKEYPAIYVIFDILYENKDLRRLPLLKRKDILNKYDDNDYFIKSKYIFDNGKKLFSSVKKLDLEGIVAKNKNGLYHINKRTDDFIKIKNIKCDNFLICGYLINKVNISLYLCTKNYKYIGKCSVSKSNDVINLIKKQKIVNRCVDNIDENINFIKPLISCNIKYTEITKNGYLRHPVFEGVIYEK